MVRSARVEETSEGVKYSNWRGWGCRPNTQSSKKSRIQQGRAQSRHGPGVRDEKNGIGPRIEVELKTVGVGISSSVGIREDGIQRECESSSVSMRRHNWQGLGSFFDLGLANFCPWLILLLMNPLFLLTGLRRPLLYLGSCTDQLPPPCPPPSQVSPSSFLRLPRCPTFNDVHPTQPGLMGRRGDQAVV